MFIISFLKQNLELRAQRHAAFRRLAQVRHKELSQDIQKWTDEKLQHPDWEIRNVAVKIVGLLDYTHQCKTLLSFITSSNQPGFIRRNSLTALRQLTCHDEDIVAPVITCLNDPYWEVRTEAALWLSQHGLPDDDICQKIISCLYKKDLASLVGYPVFWPGRIYREKNFEVRGALLLALGAVVTKRQELKALEIPLSDDMWKVREAALTAFIKASNRLGLPIDEAGNRLKNFDLTCTDFKPLFPVRNTFNQLNPQSSDRTEQGSNL